jgi:hypothetical protein
VNFFDIAVRFGRLAAPSHLFTAASCSPISMSTCLVRLEKPTIRHHTNGCPLLWIRDSSFTTHGREQQDCQPQVVCSWGAPDSGGRLFPATLQRHTGCERSSGRWCWTGVWPTPVPKSLQGDFSLRMDLTRKCLWGRHLFSGLPMDSQESPPPHHPHAPAMTPCHTPRPLDIVTALSPQTASFSTVMPRRAGLFNHARQYGTRSIEWRDQCTVRAGFDAG